MNLMREISIEKVTLNVGAGKDQSKLEKGMMLLKNITGINPVKTTTRKRIPEWGVRPGLPIGCKVTIRKNIYPLLKMLLAGKNNVLQRSHFDKRGNVSFGIHEYIEIPGVKYDPKIGVIGFEVCITLQRPGYRVRRRKKKGKIGAKHFISQDDAIGFMKSKFSIVIEDETL